MFFKNMMLFFKKKEVISVSFLFLMACTLISYIYSFNENQTLILFRASLLIANCFIVGFVFKGNDFAIKILAIMMFLYGIWTLLLGIFAIEFTQYILKLISIIVGLYFIYGSRILNNTQGQGVGSDHA